MKKSLYFNLAVSFALAFCSLSLAATPERQSSEIASQLKGISDEDWAKVAGGKMSEKYEIHSRDTLWDISSRLFGDPKVWPKVWELNNTQVLNPHMIEPKWVLVFSSGTSTTLPSLELAPSLQSSGVSTVKNHYVLSKEDRPGPVSDEKTPPPSTDWRNLPRQSWENVQIELSPSIDRDGFDMNNRIYLRKPATGLELPHWMTCNKVNALGRVTGTRSVSNFVDRGSEITIEANTTLEADKVYTLLDPEPVLLESNGRKGWTYDILGKVKILGLQSGTYIGEIQNIREPAIRGALLVPEISRIWKSPPVPGAEKIKGTIISDRRTGSFMSGQHKWVYIDRGTRDGVKPGMLFRIFQNTDPRTGKALTSGDVFVQGDTQVYQSCEEFSIGLVVWSRGETPERYQGFLLTDINDEKIRFYFDGKASRAGMTEGPAPVLQTPSGIVDQPAPPPQEEIIGPSDPSTTETRIEPPQVEAKESLKPSFDAADKGKEGPDWLDQLDNNQGLSGDEENELRELEKFRESQAAAENKAAPLPETADPLPPPPPSEAVPADPSQSFPSLENGPSAQGPSRPQPAPTVQAVEPEESEALPQL